MLITNHEDGVTLKVKVVPNASANKIVGEQDGRLVIRLTAPPVEGKANKLLIKLVSKQLKIPASSIEILHGHASREKTLLFRDCEERDLRDKLGLLA